MTDKKKTKVKKLTLVKTEKIEKIEKKPPLKMKAGDKRKGNGGKRTGSGRKKGVTTPSKAKAKRRTAGIADDLAADPTKIMPLDYLLSVLNETPDQLIADFKAEKMTPIEFGIRYKTLVARRDWAAEKSAVYLHPRLSSVTAVVTTPAHEQFIKDCEAEVAALALVQK